MKKIISVVLALTMIMMLGLTSFAAVLDGKPSDSTTANEVIVKTSTDKGTDGKDPQSYTVTIPASTVIPWGQTTAYNLEYYVKTTLLFTNQLKVTVAKGNGVMKSANAANKAEIPYTLAGAGVDAPLFVSAYADGKTASVATITVTDWSAAIDAYQDYLTFTSEIVPVA